MKKILMLIMVVLTIVMVTHGAFAGVTKKVSDDPVLVNWKFDPKVETYAGYNLDTGNLGLIGSASLDLETTIHKKADVEFNKDAGGTYGYIKVSDVKIKIDTGRKNASYNSTKNEKDKKTDPNYNNANTSPLLISWGSIKGAIHMGPVYINLKHTSHNDQNFISKSGLDKSNFSVIQYSVIPVYTTSQYAGNTFKHPGDLLGKPAGSSVLTPDAYKSEIATFKEDGALDKGGIQETFPTGGLGAFSVGFKSANLLDVRLGVSTQYTYKQHVPHNRSNPTAMSLYFELLAVENLTMKLTLTSNMGVNNNPMMYDGNPITIGLLTGYTMGNITPYVGAEFRFEKKQKVDATSTLVGATPATEAKAAVIKYTVSAGKITDIDKANSTPEVKAESLKPATIKDNDYINAFSYQFGLGVTYDWKNLGEDATEDDHLNLAPADEKATDGVSLGLIYGATPHKVFRETSVPFLGAKIAFWESESDDKPGIIPGLEHGHVINYNIALGANHKYEKSLSSDKKDVEYEFGQRHDIGLGFEVAYTVGFIKPHLGIIYKNFDFLKGKDKIKGRDDNLRLATDALDDDFRLKIGADVIKLVKNTTFKVWWESGNLINKESRRKFAQDGTFTYADSDFYTNNKSSSNSSSVFWNSAAKLGFIAVGAQIKF